MSILDKMPVPPTGTKWTTHIQEMGGRPQLALRLIRDPNVGTWEMNFNLLLDGPDTRYIDLEKCPDVEAEVISAAAFALRGYEANNRSRLERSKRIDSYSEKFSEFLVD